nr:Single-stranded DNA-binding protein [Escherichia coli O25b:H4-ST131]
MASSGAVRQLAEVAEYLRKGVQVYIEGQHRSWKITVSPVTSPKFLLRPRAPCRCWDVPQVSDSAEEGNSSALSPSRNHSRRPV